MSKSKKIIVISIIIILLILLGFLLLNDSTRDKDSETTDSQNEMTDIGEGDLLGSDDNEQGIIVTGKPNNSKGPIVSISPSENKENVSSKKPGASNKPSGSIAPGSSNEPNGSKVPSGSVKPGGTLEPSNSKQPSVPGEDIGGLGSTNEPIYTDEPTSTNTPIYSDTPISTKNPTGTKNPVSTKVPTATKNPVSTKAPTTTKKPTSTQTPMPTKVPEPPVETEAPQSSKFNITLIAPEIALVGESFQVSITTTNCAHVEWYINGEYNAGLENKINPKGNMKFDKAGIYRVTVIGYTQDWSENVYDETYIRVYTDLSQANGNAKEHDRAMYSWGHHYIYEEYEPILQKVMELTECNILYQEVASNASTSDVTAFLKRRKAHNQTVYYLCGNASWAIEKDASSMLKQVERAVAYNKAAGSYKFAGIQFDVEPYCLLDFEENADAYMAQYVKNSKLAYEAAHKEGLLVEICIPYWWDSSYGYEEELEDLIANACDSVAVMNYYKMGKEAGHIENELALCKKYNKRIINITETIPAGQHGLTENNTYYNDGIDAIEEMWNTLDGFFQYEELGYAFHYLDIIIEMLGLS